MRLNLRTLNIFRSIFRISFFGTAILGEAMLFSSCGQNAFLKEITDGLTTLGSGDVIVVSGGTVARTTSPFPNHIITAFYSDGRFKTILQAASNNEYYIGASLTPDGSGMFYTVDGLDRIEKINFDTPTIATNQVTNPNLSGTNLRAMATLDDGGTVIAESSTVIEKFDSNGNRVTVNFPLTITANIMKIRKISGGRFVVITTGGSPDSPRIYNDAGTLQGTLPLGLACANNCDPSDILELKDGRFLVAIQAITLHSLELYTSNFAHVGQFFRDTTVLQTPSALAQTLDGDIIVCSTALNTCEKIQLIGSTGVRVGSSSFIDDTSLMRQPTDILVIP